MTSSTLKLIESYYDAFNKQDMPRFLSLVSDDIAHDINQGGREVGKKTFGQFMVGMNEWYSEKLTDIAIMVNAVGTRAAAEFIVHGTYKHSAPGLPAATGQKYVLPAGTFFEIKSGLIKRVTTYYNLEDWLSQVR